ncbi:unnamed protein product [Rhizopus stolonifer]
MSSQEKDQYQPPPPPTPSRHYKKRLVAFFCGLFFLITTFCLQPSSPDFSHLASHCESIQPIPSSEYAARHRRLYETLIDLDHQGFLMEGGATMRYYTNIDWELTERPFLILLLRNDTLETGIQMVIFSPTFESTKAAKKLEEARLPTSIHHQILTWDEHQSPFDLVQSVVKDSKILMESNVRLFIFEGLERLLKIKMAPVSIRQLRMIKSAAELAILRCANEVTQMAIGAVRPFIKVGMNEREIQRVMTKALVAAGLSQTWVLALVDQDAALPHGDSGERQVQKESVVLIDTGGELHGYQSDTTRTFFMAPKGFNQTIENAWYLVKEAQESVLNQISVGNTAAQVDLAARDVIEKAGYGPYFTHRLGHGIGLEMHEEPYMNKGNTELVLTSGMTFSVEPGVYLVNEFGIRLEDIVVVNQQGQLELLTNGLAHNPWTLSKDCGL